MYIICWFCQTHHHTLESSSQWLSKGSSCQKQSTSATPSKVVGAGSMTAKVPIASTANPFSAVTIFSFQWKPCCTWTLWTAFFTGCDVETERAIGRKNNMIRSSWLGRRAPGEEDSDGITVAWWVRYVLWNFPLAWWIGDGNKRWCDGNPDVKKVSSGKNSLLDCIESAVFSFWLRFVLFWVGP